jgi:5-methylcytosine-specific restriction endonuclease McrA
VAGDPRYGSLRWKQIRRQVIARAGGLCEIQGPHCTTTATTCDHVVPVSLGGAFFAGDNLRAACKRCNYSAGPAIREAGIRQTLHELEELVEQQHDEIQRLLARIAELEGDGTRTPVGKPRPQPAVY